MVQPVAFQPFGRLQDLELEFASADRPRLVTTLLAGSGESADFWWAQTVGTRIAALLRIVALTEGEDATLPVGLRCSEDACGEKFEITLPYAALSDVSPDDTAHVTVPLDGGRAAILRRPTGSDLRDWRGVPCESRPQAVAAMLDALVVEGKVEPDDVPLIADAMAEHDPLVAFSVSCTCPACGAENDQAVDLEVLALIRLAAVQRALLRDIHVLASRYGWTEREVLAVAPARRARYRFMIEDAPIGGAS
jgi:hypothetical protein